MTCPRQAARNFSLAYCVVRAFQMKFIQLVLVFTRSPVSLDIEHQHTGQRHRRPLLLGVL